MVEISYILRRIRSRNLLFLNVFFKFLGKLGRFIYSLNLIEEIFLFGRGLLGFLIFVVKSSLFGFRIFSY